MVDFSGEAAQTIIVGQVIENHMVPKFPKAQYTTDNTGKPCIDGNYRSDFNPVIFFDVDPTRIAKGTSAMYTEVGFIDMNTKLTYLYGVAFRYRNRPDSSDSTGNYTTIYLRQYECSE